MLNCGGRMVVNYGGTGLRDNTRRFIACRGAPPETGGRKWHLKGNGGMGKSLDEIDGSLSSHEQGSRLWQRGGDLFALSLASAMLIMAPAMNGPGGLPAHASSVTDVRKSEGTQSLDALASAEVKILADTADKSSNP